MLPATNTFTLRVCAFRNAIYYRGDRARIEPFRRILLHFCATPRARPTRVSPSLAKILSICRELRRGSTFERNANAEGATRARVYDFNGFSRSRCPAQRNRRARARVSRPIFRRALASRVSPTGNSNPAICPTQCLASGTTARQDALPFSLRSQLLPPSHPPSLFYPAHNSRFAGAVARTAPVGATHASVARCGFAPDK